ncbi:MAG: DNA/RNA nuclease SfsA, partial [Gammaproteobacteria bacterium]|nr:DNA/RNA nuclease SfsA [Gammaproteobacteria bacterium]
MRYPETVRAKFIERPNRFIARAELDGEEVVCHVKNTG